MFTRFGVVFWFACLLGMAHGPAAPVMRVVRSGSGGANLLRNASFEQAATTQLGYWAASPNGYRKGPGEGRNGSGAMVCVATNTLGWHGGSQQLTLNQTNAAPIVVRGWSRAEGVSGGTDSGYGLYVDLVYRDGTPLWGQVARFSTGSHDWEEGEVIILPEKPVRSLTLYCIFRGHSGKVWFDDLSLGEVRAAAGAFLFQGTPMAVEPPAGPPTGETSVHATGDGLELELRSGRVTGLGVGSRQLAVSAPSGFLARDVAGDSDVFAFENGACPELNLRLEAAVTPRSDHLVIEGRVEDTTGKDRAVMLLFALPIDLLGWNWEDDIRHRRIMSTPEEFSYTTQVNCGANGQQSLYPLGCVHDRESGVALGVDMARPAQFRFAAHAGTRQLLLAYDFGLVPETRPSASSAAFRFVLYRFDPASGFRSAFKKFTAIFPEHFLVRSREQGIWMPFTDVATVRGWADFGFRYHEGTNNLAFDDHNGISSFRYTEPMTWWMPMAPELPRTLESALAVRDQYASGPAGYHQRMAVISRAAAMLDAAGQPAMVFRNEPWANGAVWSLNPNPRLPPHPNAATIHWSGAIRDQLYRTNSGKILDGEYLDSLEGYVTADLSFQREHFPYSSVPLTFARGSARPALWKALSAFEFAREVSTDLHAIGKVCFANSVPNRFCFLVPWLDVLGTEVNWLPGGQYTPASHPQMGLWRTLCGGKPFLLLMNTDYDRFGPALVEKYFQRCLFYGIYPSMFSHNASENPYWQNPAWYDRDRPLFQRYIPAIREVAEAGWQPVPDAVCGNTNVLLEQFGPRADGSLYFTLFNDSTQTQSVVLAPTPALERTLTHAPAFDLLSGARIPAADAGWRVVLPPHSCAAVKLEPAAEFLEASVAESGTARLKYIAPPGSIQILERSADLATWIPLATNIISTQSSLWEDATAPGNTPRFYRLRRP